MSLLLASLRIRLFVIEVDISFGLMFLLYFALLQNSDELHAFSDY